MHGERKKNGKVNYVGKSKEILTLKKQQQSCHMGFKRCINKICGNNNTR